MDRGLWTSDSGQTPDFGLRTNSGRWTLDFRSGVHKGVELEPKDADHHLVDALVNVSLVRRTARDRRNRLLNARERLKVAIALGGGAWVNREHAEQLLEGVERELGN